MTQTKLERGNSGEMTEARWQMLDFAIKAFFSKFPGGVDLFKYEMYETKEDLADEEYGLASDQHKEIKAANHRHTASFPVIYNPETKQHESLLPVLEKMVPDLITDDKKYNEFLKRYPIFKVARKI